MIVDINTDFLINNKITADQYFILALILAGKQTILKDYYLVNNISVEKLTEDIGNLGKRGFVEGYVGGLYDFTNLKVSKYIKDNFNEGDFWKEFLNTFPAKVVRADGTTDYLRTDQTKAHMIYLAYVKGRKSIHDHIIKCLKHEVKFREANGSMRFMKRMVSWLNAKEWEAYQDQIDDLGTIQNNTNDMGYGTELL